MLGSTENAGLLNHGQNVRTENGEPKNEGPENEEPDCEGIKRRTRQWRLQCV